MAKTLKTPRKTLKNSWAMEDYFRRLFLCPTFALGFQNRGIMNIKKSSKRNSGDWFADFVIIVGLAILFTVCFFKSFF